MDYYKNLSLENIVEEVDGVVYEERWSTIKGYEGLYEVSDFGRLKSLKRIVVYSNGRSHLHISVVLKQFESRRGYLRVTLFKNGKRTKSVVQVLVARAFIKNPEAKKTVNHLFGDKKDNRVKSLGWATHSEQNLHAYSELNRDKTFGKAISVAQFDSGGQFIKLHKSYKLAEIDTSVCKTSIIDCVNGRAKTAGGFVWLKQ